MPAALERENDPVLLHWRNAGEDIEGFRGMFERRVGHHIDVVSANYRCYVHADPIANVARDKLIVAGNDLHGHAIGAERSQHFRGILEWGVGKSDETGETESGFVGNRIRLRYLYSLRGHGQCSKPASAQFLKSALTGGARGFIQLGGVIAILRGIADRKNSFGRPLRDEDSFRSALHDH